MGEDSSLTKFIVQFGTVFLVILNALTLVSSNPYHAGYLRNEFDFWNAHGIMNTSIPLQRK